MSLEKQKYEIKEIFTSTEIDDIEAEDICSKLNYTYVKSPGYKARYVFYKKADVAKKEVVECSCQKAQKAHRSALEQAAYGQLGQSVSPLPPPRNYGQQQYSPALEQNAQYGRPSNTEAYNSVDSGYQSLSQPWR